MVAVGMGVGDETATVGAGVADAAGAVGGGAVGGSPVLMTGGLTGVDAGVTSAATTAVPVVAVGEQAVADSRAASRMRAPGKRRRCFNAMRPFQPVNAKRRGLADMAWRAAADGHFRRSFIRPQGAGWMSTILPKPLISSSQLLPGVNCMYSSGFVVS